MNNMSSTNGVGLYNYFDSTKNIKTDKSSNLEEAEAEKLASTEEKTDATAASTAKQTAETYKPDMDKINAMKADLKGNMAAFKKMVYAQMKDQGINSETSLKDIISKLAQKATPEEIEAAKQSVSEDGEWGVKATADRILDFAKALTGGDPDKIDSMKEAFQKGFAAAEKAWGGQMPDITKQTYDRVMQGFDDWKNGNAAYSDAQTTSNVAAATMV